MDTPPWLRRLGLGLAAMGVAGLAGIFAFLHTGPGERWISGKLEQTVAGLELDGFHLGWPFRMRADYLRLADAQGAWLEATAPELVWHPLRLWRRALDIDRLVARRVEVRRLPRRQDEAGGEVPALADSLRLGEVDLPISLATPVLGAPIELELSGTAMMSGAGGIVDLSLRARSGDFIRIAGTAGTDFLDLRWYLHLPDLTRWQRLTGIRMAGTAAGTGVIAGRLPSPEISGRAEFGPGSAAELGWRQMALSGRVVPEPAAWRLALQAEMQAPHWQGQKLPAATAALALVGDLAPGPGRLRLGFAQLTMPMAVVEGAGVLENWGRQSFLRLRAMTGAGMVTGGAVTGRLWARGILAGDLLAPALTGRLDLRGENIATGIVALGRALGPHPHANLVLHGRDGRLDLGPSRLDGARASLWATGAVLPRLDLWAILALPEAAVLADGVSGNVEASAHLGGTPAAPTVAGLARLNRIGMGGAPPGDGALAFDLPEPARPRGHLSAAVTVAGTPLTASARLEHGKGIRLDDLTLASGQSHMAGALEFGDGIHGHLSGSIPQLQQWQELAGIPLSGRVDAEAALDPEYGQSLRLSVHGSDVAFAGLTLPSLAAQVDMTGLSGTPTATLTATGRAEAGGRSLDDIALRASGRMGRVVVETAELSTTGIPIRLLRPVPIDWRGGTVTVPAATLTVGDGQIVATGQFRHDGLDAHLRLTALPLTLSGAEATGTVSGTIDAGGSPTAPDIRFSLSGQGIGLVQTAAAGLGRLTARLDGGWRDGRMRARAEMADGRWLYAQAEGSLPLPGDGAIEGHVHAQGDAGRLAEALPLAGHVLSGRLDADAAIAGTLAQPRLTGHADLTGGRYENLDNGTVVAPLRATAHLAGDRIRLSGDGGDGGGGGQVKLSGEVGLGGDYQADIVLDHFAALHRGDVEATVDGTLRLVGNGSAGRLAGQLTIPRAEVDVGRIKGGGPVRLEVVEINRPGAPAPPKTEPSATPQSLALAVRLAIEHAFVRGRGLDSEWQGVVDVAGTATRPSLTGRLLAARGQLDVLGKVFKLTPDSAVIFQGGESIDPSLALTAEASAADITAQVQVTGTAKTPDIAFTSSPPLPPDEVLARLLFGREAGKLSAFQQIQLAQLAAGGLTGEDGGFDPVGSLRGFLGLDVLGVGADTDRAGTGTGGPTLSAGKYIGPDTFVRVDQGTVGLGRVTVEQSVGGGFAVESSLGEQSGGGIGLSWRQDY